ncbi:MULTISPECIES: hypothetical protein [unclassified Kaistella]|uniref:hypothetical protein n=1 Tax=unclassified Kaistella TaxID=2762626 RepID=UPI002734C50B|nr:MULTISPECIES: hypothetical protein [unclassified Kaistella]MDP2454358.1 hypothetical protein [Kaistella sp. SH11-4b]MDP2457845.1 hypothetical protein [Kaistella sp. SH40-3]MDP2460751.1 hypothetical protein [Kaistella sp. SH19-2b]
MKKFFFLFSILMMTSCNHENIKSYTFYYWRTHLSLNAAEKTVLQKATSPYIYTRFFDIEKVDGKFQPVAVITKDQTFETDKEIVPVVFIKNDVFYDISSNEINFLAENVNSLIKKKQTEFGIKISKEIQIDCDWTAGTRKEYFEFLQRLKDFSKKEITCTLRLHQVKNSKLSGIPPAEKVYLMCYSTSSPLENSDRNSILDLPTLKNYLKNVDLYPLDMDIALPIYSWGIVTNHVGKHKLINALSTEDLKNANFRKISDNEVEIMKDGFYFGNFLNKGFTIKVEEISEDQLTETKNFLNKKLTNYAIVYYQLDHRFLDKHQF